MAQRNFTNKTEFGLWAGGANYVGDIRAALQEQPGITRPAVGVYYRNNFDRRWSLKLMVAYGSITSADELSDNSHEQARNLSFRNTITEASMHVEFNFRKYILGQPRNNFTPYVFLGIGVFSHNPQAQFNGQWHDLQPLGTEGQLFTSQTGLSPYNLIQVSVPYGGGLKWSVTKHLTLGLEVGYRSTFTDYLDDISTQYYDNTVIRSGPSGDLAADLADRSGEVLAEPIGIEGRQRGDSRSTDAYVFSGITISYTFRKRICPPPSRSGF